MHVLNILKCFLNQTINDLNTFLDDLFGKKMFLSSEETSSNCNHIIEKLQYFSTEFSFISTSKYFPQKYYQMSITTAYFLETESPKKQMRNHVKSK